MRFSSRIIQNGMSRYHRYLWNRWDSYSKQIFFVRFCSEILKYADSILDPKFVCEKVGLCPSETKPKMLVGANKCTFGPSYWCASMDNAEECNAKEHCLKMGLLN